MGRFKELGAWMVAILLCGTFLLTGGLKLVGAPEMLASFHRWGYPTWFAYAVGLVESLSALALLVPQLAFFGAIGLITIMFGAMWTHAVSGEWAMVVVPLALGAMAAWLAWTRRPHFVRGPRRGEARSIEFASAMPEARDRPSDQDSLPRP